MSPSLLFPVTTLVRPRFYWRVYSLNTIHRSISAPTIKNFTGQYNTPCSRGLFTVLCRLTHTTASRRRLESVPGRNSTTHIIEGSMRNKRRNSLCRGCIISPVSRRLRHRYADDTPDHSLVRSFPARHVASNTALK